MSAAVDSRRQDAARFALVSTQDGELRSRFIVKLANAIAGVCFDLPFSPAQRDLDMFDGSRQLANALLHVDPTGVNSSRCLHTWIAQGHSPGFSGI